jgi:hypothetical protein
MGRQGRIPLVASAGSTRPRTTDFGVCRSGPLEGSADDDRRGDQTAPPDPLAEFELRVGDLRVLYSVEDDEVVLLIVGS